MWGWTRAIVCESFVAIGNTQPALFDIEVLAPLPYGQTKKTPHISRGWSKTLSTESNNKLLHTFHLWRIHCRVYWNSDCTVTGEEGCLAPCDAEELSILGEQAVRRTADGLRVWKQLDMVNGADGCHRTHRQTRQRFLSTPPVIQVEGKRLCRPELCQP